MMNAVKSLLDPKHLRDESLRSLDSAGSAILTVSMGILVLSVTFRKSIVGDEPITIWLLIVAWIALLIVPASFILHYLFRGVLFSEILGTLMPLEKSEKASDKLLNQLHNRSGVMFVIMSAAFVVGVSCFGIFALLNLSRLTAGQVRSYVQVVEATLIEPINDASFIQVQLKIKNFGQTAAVNVYGEMDYALGIPDPHGKGNEATRRKFGSMGPGLERTFTLQSNRINRRGWPAPSPNKYQTVYFWGTVWYTDDATQENRKEDWCYELPLKTEADLNRTNLEPCTILTYTSR